MSAQARVSADAQAMMAYDAGKKSPVVAYLLWLFLSGFGAHRFYLGRPGSAVAQVLLFFLGWLTVVFVIGFALLAIWGIWVLVDAFLIPGLCHQHNQALATRLGSSAF